MTKFHTAIGLINPKSPSNVGSVMRAAGCFQVDSVAYTGTRYDRAVQFKTDTKNIRQHIPLIAIADLFENRTEGSSVVCVELAENAICLPEYKHPEKALYIFGPEDGTIPENIINKADDVVYIPTIGCLNLAATVNIVLYDRQVKLHGHHGGNDLIRNSRDTNNKLIVS